MLKEKQMPSMMWGEAIRHYVYIFNRLPTRALTGVTPYEVWTKRKPYVGHVLIFGCVAQMKVPSTHLKKLDDRSKCVVYLGKDPGTKAHRLVDPNDNKVYVSRDVMFEEDKAWSWNREGGALYDQSRNFVVNLTEEIERTMTDEPVTQESINSTSIEESGGETSHAIVSSESNDSGYSSDPTLYRSLNDVYNHTEEIELEEELLFVGIDELKNYKETIKESCWKQVMKNEIESIEKNNTWELKELPLEHKAIDLKWIFKIKKNVDGEVVKHKSSVGC